MGSTDTINSRTNRRSLDQKFRRSGLRKRVISHLLVAPLVLFIVVVFVFPIGSMLFMAIDSPEVEKGLPRLTMALPTWVEGELPPEPVFEAVALDLTDDNLKFLRAGAARRLNYEITGFRTLVMSTARKIDSEANGAISSWKDDLISLDKRWGQPTYWQALRRASSSPYVIFLACSC